MKYALSDSFTGMYPKEYTAGFANTKVVIAFKTEKERKEWIGKTRLTTARALTRSEALKMAETDDWNNKICRLYGCFKIIQESKNHKEYCTDCPSCLCLAIR